MIWECKECGRISYTGKFCLNCDLSFWNFAKRRYAIQVFFPSFFIAVIGILLMAMNIEPLAYIIWGIGMLGLFVFISMPFWIGRFAYPRLFTPKEKDARTNRVA